MNQPANDETSAEELLACVAGHDEEALGALYDRFAPRIAGILSRILPARAEAEEVLQEVFGRLWDDAKQLATREGSVAAWLMVTARQLAIDRLRASRMGPARAVQTRLANVTGSRSTGRSTPRKSAAARGGESTSMNSDLLAALVALWLPRRKEIELTEERFGLLQKAIHQLPKSQRQAVDLAVFGGYTEREIAQMLGEPLGKAKSGVRAAVTFIKHRRHAVMGTWAANI